MPRVAAAPPPEEEELEEGDPLVRKSKLWGDTWTGLSARSLQLMKNSASTAELLNAALNEKQALNENQAMALAAEQQAMALAAKKTLMMNVHVTSRAEQQVRVPLLRALARSCAMTSPDMASFAGARRAGPRHRGCQNTVQERPRRARSRC